MAGGLEGAVAATFAMSRSSGRIAHAIEQRAANGIIRPHSVYAGPRDRRWVPIEQRTAQHVAPR